MGRWKRGWFAVGRGLRAVGRGIRNVELSTFSAVVLAVLAIGLTIARGTPFVKNLIPGDFSFADSMIVFVSAVILLLQTIKYEIREDTAEILRLMKGAKFTQFTTGDEQMLHIARQINRAKRSVCDVSWVDYMSPERMAPERKAAQLALDDAIVAFSAHKPYREIFMFRDVPEPIRKIRLDSLRARTKEKENVDGYYCAYFARSEVPLLQFMVVDDEVMLRSFDNDVGDYRCSIEHPVFARLFRSYYARLWDKARVLKDQHGIDEGELRKVLDEVAPAPNQSEPTSSKPPQDCK